MTAGRLGVVIVNWNGLAHLVNCLDSIYGGDLLPHSVVVVDNGSRDGSPQAAKAAHPAVTLIINQSNLGFARANNMGARVAIEAGCELILFLNNDTVVGPDALRHMVRTAAEPGVTIVNPLITDLDGGVWFSGARFRPWRGDVAHEHELLDASSGARPIGSATGCALLIHSDQVHDSGPFDERYFIYWEDADLSARIGARGGRIVLEPAARIQHRVSADSLSNAPSGFFYYLNTRNRLLFVRTHASTPQWAAFLLRWSLTYVIPRTLALAGLGRLAKARALARGYTDYFRGRFGGPQLD